MAVLAANLAVRQRRERAASDGSRLGPTAERDLLLAARDDDEQARELLVQAFLPAIGGVARLYRHSAKVDRGELIQEGVVGLLNALERYDVERGTPFWAYATWWVRQAMQSLVAQTGGAVVLSDRALRQLARVKDARSTHLQSRGKEPSTDDLSDATGLSRSHVQSLVAAERMPRGLDEPLTRDPDVSGAVSEALADPRSEDDFDHVVLHMAAEELRTLPGGLSERERMIVKSRYGIGRPAETLREVAVRLGLSAERVRQIEQTALTKLRAAAESTVPARPKPRQTALAPLPKPRPGRLLPRPGRP
jgi:RNA polymerase sigma factor (sigma-70 family)